ncbi:MAG TPA: hypothetical protein VJ652_02950 [Noviherbaspirillum sp.]|nr:hypothetical protein [Noviherbaspirillum sp.]
MTPILAALAVAASTTVEDVPLVEIEKHYWDCDYAVRQTLLDFSDAEHCSRVFERLKKEKFSGDFHTFLAWWQANKDREYAVRAHR